MAEFNIFLGSARKSVGDVTLLRRNGRQIARVRLRTIANPRSEAQSIQRNYVAPVTRFFGLLRTVLKCSYQGLNREASYNQFQKTNIRLAKANGWFLPKGAGFFPMPYQLSRGSVQPIGYTKNTVGNVNYLELDIPWSSNATPSIGAVSRAFVNGGYREGDVVTCISVCSSEGGTYYPVSIQFTLNTSSAAQFKNLYVPGCKFKTDSPALMMYGGDDEMVAGAVIISRWADGRWLRSTQFLWVLPSIVSTLQSESQREEAIASYMAGGSDSGGSVYPGGGEVEYNVQAQDGRALLFIGGQLSARSGSGAQVNFVQVRPVNVDAYYYIVVRSGDTLASSVGGSIDPTDWEFMTGTPADIEPANTISYSAGNAIALWLESVGFDSD